MPIPTDMQALLLVNDGYAATPSGSVLEAMEPYVALGIDRGASAQADATADQGLRSPPSTRPT